MTVAKITEITSTSTESFDDAIKQGVARASKTLENIQSAWVADQRVSVKEGETSEYIVRMKLTFVLND
jgi:flavin-binding protein dodecin